jgi:hypothetical protein
VPNTSFPDKLHSRAEHMLHDHSANFTREEDERCTREKKKYSCGWNRVNESQPSSCLICRHHPAAVPSILAPQFVITSHRCSFKSQIELSYPPESPECLYGRWGEKEKREANK